MPKIKEYPNKEYFDKYFMYDIETGKLLWKINRSHARVGREVGSVQKYGYLKVRFENASYYVHRIIWVMNKGSIPQSSTIDHIDGDTQNNRMENLRLADMSTQGRNRRLYKKNTSGHSGVSERKGKWTVTIGGQERKIWLGTFATKEEAIEAKKAKEREIGFHKNHATKDRKRYSKNPDCGRLWTVERRRISK